MAHTKVFVNGKIVSDHRTKEMLDGLEFVTNSGIKIFCLVGCKNASIAS